MCNNNNNNNNKITELLWITVQVLLWILKCLKFNQYLVVFCIGCSLKFPVKVGVEESIVNAPRMTTLIKLFKSNITFWFVCVFHLQVDDRLTSDAFTIDSSTPTFWINIQIQMIILQISNYWNPPKYSKKYLNTVLLKLHLIKLSNLPRWYNGTDRVCF
jgi:hypothetical protein